MTTQRIVLVTGAAGGIGSALVRRLVRDGDRVIGADVNTESLHALHRELGSPDAFVPAPCDITRIESCQALAGIVSERCGRLDVLVNNAGHFPVKAFEAMTYEEWRLVVTLNLDGVFLMTKSFLALLKRSPRGRIVNVASASVFKGPSGQSHYVAAKAGVIGLSRVLASELGASGINVNVVTPGLTSTAAALATFTPEGFAARRNQRALKREQTAEDVVGAVVFLAGADADFITGQIINVDGGAVMH